jgi:putative ABC transport system permease protein
MSMQAAGAVKEHGMGTTGAPDLGKRRLPMVHKLAYKNLFHDTLSLTVTLVGIVFSVVLVAVQLGMYEGTEWLVTSVIDRAPADLWVVPLQTKSFDDPFPLVGREKQAILSTPGVGKVNEMFVSFVNWRRPGGGSTTASIIGLDDLPNSPLPWDIELGSKQSILAPAGVAVDAVYFKELGIKGLGDKAEVNGMQVTVTAVTHGIRSFTTVPYVFTSIANARAMTDSAPEQAAFIRVQLADGANLDEVRKRLAFRLPNTDVITHDEFRQRNIGRWMFETGAGVALIAGTALGIIVGVVIVAQTLYSSTKDHLNEFATLRALGASAGYINKVILIQAVLSAVIGYAVGMALSIFIVWMFKVTESELPIAMTPMLAGSLFVLTVGMCVIAAIGAIFKVIRIDPAAVFSR